MKTGIFKHIFWVTLAGMAFLTGCSKEDGLPGGTEPAAVTLNASVEALSRTTAGGDQWVQNDEVGVYILTAGGGWPGGFLAGAENKKYKVSDASKGTLSPTDDQDIYYPKTGNLDIVAYYPYGTPETSPTWSNLDYTIKIDFTDQSDPIAIDLLWAKAENAGKSKTPVDLQFNHLFTKITLNISPGKGFSAEDMAALAAGDVTGKLVTGSMTADLVTGMVMAVDQETTVSLYKNTQPASGYAATFSAIIASGCQDNLDITFTVNGAPYTCTLTHDEFFKAGSNYVYPVTVSKTGVTVGEIAIKEWSVYDNNKGTGEAEIAEIQPEPESNCYMVRPYSREIFIPVSRANKAADPAYNLGADATGLGGVEAGNYTVELLWGDAPIGPDGVIKRLAAVGENILVEPGKAGNAVICIRDKASGIIKWSWHIWVTEPVGEETDTETGLTWMDRNLGAMSNTPFVDGTYDRVQWTKTVGLYYQWGRKDAFPGVGENIYENQFFYTAAGEYTDELLPTGEYTNLPEMVQNPLAFATNYETYYGSLNVAGYQNDSWGSNSNQKTIYDPCPPGWKVVPEIKGCWSADDKSLSEDNGEWTFVDYIRANRGALFHGVGGTAGLNHFYPAQGQRNGGSGKVQYVSDDGCYWSSFAVASGNISRCMYITNSIYFNSIYFNSSTTRSNGFAIRCVRE